MNNKEIIVNYFKNNEKAPGELYFGPEYEHIIVDRNTYKSVSYYGERGVNYVFKRLVELGWKPYMEGEHILGADYEDLHVTTEPGGQFEFSSDKKETLEEVEEDYKRFFKMLLPILDELEYDILAIGYHPVTKIEDIKLLPKKRYDTMFNHFKTHGTMGHNMMKGTGALQLSIDYTSEEDYTKKFVVGNAISNVLYSMFENVLFFQGEPVGHNQRARIWEHTDPDRSGLARNAFIDDTFEGYADYIVNTKAIFAYQDGEMVATGEEIIDNLMDESTTKDELEHLLTMVFPDVRTKKFLEFRMMDAVPYPYNFSAFALIKGIFYDEDNLNYLYETLRETTRKEVMDSRHEMYELGEEAKYLGSTMKEWKLKLLELAKNALGEEVKYLEPLEELVNSYGSFYNRSKAIYEETNDVKAAVSGNRITKEVLCIQTE